MRQQPMGIAQPPMHRPQVPPQMARTPQFGAAKQVVMEGLPQIYQQLEELVTLKAVDLVNSADRQEAMDGDPGQNNMQVAEGSIKSEAQQGIINALANMQRPQQPPQQPPMPQQAMGLPQLPANNMAMPRAAQGGIVGFAGKGPSLVEEPATPTVEQQRERYKRLKELEAKYMAEGNQEALNNVRRALENYEGSVAAQPDKPTPENTLQMAGGGIVAFNPGGFVEIDGKQVPVYQQQFRDFTEPSDQQKDFEDIVSWIQTYNVEPEISNAILRNPNSVAGDQIDTLKQVLVGAGGRTLDEINRMVANFPSFNTGQNVNPRGERNFSRLEDSPEPQGLMALGQRRAGENEERRRANRSQPMTPEEIARQRVMAGLSSGVEEPPLSEFQQSLVDAGEANVGQQLLDAQRRMELEEQKPKVDADFVRSYLAGNATPDEEGIASLTSSNLPITRDEARRRFQESQAIFSGPSTDDPPITRDEARRRFQESQAIFSGPSTDDAPLTAEQLASINENIAKYDDSLGASLVRRIKENPVEAVSTAMMLIPVGGWAGGLGIKAVSKLVPYIIKHPMLASFLTGSAAKLPLDKINIEGALNSMGLGEDYEEVAETLLTAGFGPDPLAPPPQTDAEVAREVIETSPEGGEATAGVVGEVNLTPRRSQADQIAEAGFTSNIQTKPQAGLAAFDPDARANTNENTSTSVVEISELVDSVGSGGTGVNYQAEMDRIIARDTNPIRTLAQYGMAFGKGNTPLEGMQLGNEMLNGIEKKLDTDRRALMGLIEAQRISERDAKIARQRLAIQQDQVDAMREGDYARVLGSIFAADARMQMTPYQQAQLELDIEDQDLSTGALRQQAEATIYQQLFGDKEPGGFFSSDSEGARQREMGTDRVQALVNREYQRLIQQKTQRITGQ